MEKSMFFNGQQNMHGRIKANARKAGYDTPAPITTKEE